MKHIETLKTPLGDIDIYLDSSAQSGDEFYARMGRLFANKVIVQELGEPFTDSPDHTWAVAIHDGCVVGVGSLQDLGKKKGWLTHAFVCRLYRRYGVHRALFRARLEHARAIGLEQVQGLAVPTTVRTFEREGFSLAGKRGSFSLYELLLVQGVPLL